MRGDVTTNTVEGAFSIFKRGMRGVYQHCAEKHCTATLPSSSSATATAKRPAATTKIASTRCFVVSSASA